MFKTIASDNWCECTHMVYNFASDDVPGFQKTWKDGKRRAKALVGVHGTPLAWGLVKKNLC